MLNILDIITDWIKGILRDCIMGNLDGMFDQINSEVGEVAANVGTTPAAWNAGVFSMIRNLSDNVVVPIAGMIITFVLCYELISMLMEKNNFHDFETFAIYKWILKAFIAVYLVTHTFDITMAIFEMGQNVVQQNMKVGPAGDLPDQHGIDRHADHNEKALQTKSHKAAQVVVAHLPPLPVGHGGEGNRADRAVDINFYLL